MKIKITSGPAEVLSTTRGDVLQMHNVGFVCGRRQKFAFIRGDFLKNPEILESCLQGHSNPSTDLLMWFIVKLRICK